MAILSQLLSFSSLTLAATAEWLLAIKLFPNYYSSQTHLASATLIFLVNYAFGIFFWAILYPNFFSPLRHIPGPRAVFSAAHRALIVKDRPAGDLFLDLAKQYPGQDFISLDALGNRILVTSPRLMADLLVHRCYDFTKPKRISSFLRHILGDGLVIVEGDQHKFLRKNSMPAFHFRHIKDLYPMMWTQGEKLMAAVNEEIHGNVIIGSTGSSVIELNSWANKVTFDIIGIAGLGRKFDVVQKKMEPLQDVYEQLLQPDREKLIFSMLALAVGLPLVRMIPWKMNATFNHLTASLSNICRPMIQEKRAAIMDKEDDHFDILSLLIKTDNFTDAELKDQLLTFLAAGHETTASAFTWTCYLLTRHPEIQNKLREEVAAAVPADLVIDPTVELAAILEQLPYLNGIMHETLRLYPTVPMTMRQAICDTHIGDQFIPKGTDIIVSIWLINRSPDIWGPDAAEFRPERWITPDGKPNQNGGASSNYDFLTFLHGPRSCIGQNFAKAEMRCLLAAMVRSFSWSLAMDDALVVPRGVITIKPENGMYLKLTPLDKQ
ncbi:cytochrome P450 [Ilyonectria sp. MPI-CAGE-AT-0026]|nr:cytochrome P450 [Ilyonectria sp. MPI-CAGE-AT-0026]